MSISPEFWDWLITALIILGLIFAIWSRITGQRIIELLRDIRDFFIESKENVTERGGEFILYE